MPPVVETPSVPEEIIQVLIPSGGHLVVNPYHLPVSTSYGETRDQVVHEPQTLESLTSFPVRVSAQVVGTIQSWSDAYFVSAPPADSALDKQIFLYAEFQNDPAAWSGWFGDWTNQILVTDWNAGKEDVLTLEPFGAGYFRLFGAMSSSPQRMWTEEDAPDVTFAFTFSPVEEATLPAGEPDIFAPPVQEPEPEPPADIPAEPAEELPADVPAAPAEELPAEPSEEPPEDVPADSLAPLPEDHAAGTLDGSSDPAPAPSEDLLDPDLVS